MTSWWWSSITGSPEGDARRLAALRLWIGGFALIYVCVRLPDLIASARLPAVQFARVGVTRLLGAPLPLAAVIAIAVATIALLAAFVAGVAYRWTAPAAALGLLWTLTYRNSWGMVFHTENLLVLHVLALAFAPAADAFAVGKPRGSPAGYAWAIRLCIALVAVTYVLAAIAKLRLAGTGWLDGEQLRNQIAIDNLRKALLGDWTAPLAIPLLEHPAGFTVFSLMTLVLELGSPIALAIGMGRFGTALARLWAFGAWGFHVGVVLLMNIWFPYPLFGFAYLAVLAPERPVAWIARRVGMWRGRRRLQRTV
jgi:hypothetical protein